MEPPPEGGWPFRTVMTPSAFREDEYRLWAKYQQRVHGDKPGKLSKSSFTNFLVANPFEGGTPHASDPDSPECGYGAFHLQFWIGEYLVAISVVDVLPRYEPSVNGM